MDLWSYWSSAEDRGKRLCVLFQFFAVDDAQLARSLHNEPPSPRTLPSASRRTHPLDAFELLADTPSVQGLGAPPSPSRGGILFFPNNLRHRTSASLGSNSSQYGVPLSRAPATFTGDFALKLCPSLRG